MTLFAGKTIKGDGRGKILGFPTINLTINSKQDTSELQNNAGVFIVELSLRNKNLKGLLHLGSRPTFNETEFRIEIFVLETLSNISTDTNNILDNIKTNTDINFNIMHKIREVIKFDSSKKLAEQITKDVQTAEKFYSQKSS